MKEAPASEPLKPFIGDAPAEMDSHEQAWAMPVSKLKVTGVPEGAINLNVDGRRVTNPLQGFGQLWQKVYHIHLNDARIAPQEVIAIWRAHFSEFWPEGNRFYGPLTSIQPGEVAVLNLAGPGGMKGPGGALLISTGILVIYADEESFSFLTPQGHMFNGLITFSSFMDEGITVAQVHAMVRASDPLYEMSFRLGFGHKTEDQFWLATLQNLAARFGVVNQARKEVTLLDPRVQWSQAKNIWHNAAVRTGLYHFGAPVRWVKKKLN